MFVKALRVRIVYGSKIAWAEERILALGSSEWIRLGFLVFHVHAILVSIHPPA